MIPVIVSILAVTTVLVYTLVKWKHQYWKRRGIPQLNPNLIFGDFGPIFTRTASYKDFFTHIYKTAKSKGYKYIGLYSATIPQLVVVDPDIIKNILSKDFTHFASRASLHHKSSELTHNLLSMEGEEWRNRRKNLSPLFTSGKLKNIFGTMAATADQLVEVVNNMIDEGKVVACKDLCARFTTDIISTVAFGLECNSLKEPEHIFRKIGKKIFEVNVVKSIAENTVPENILTAIKYQRFPSDVRNYFTSIVKDTIAYRLKNNFNRKDFLQLMIDLKTSSPNTIDENDIINESFTFFVGGFETSSTTITFALLELAINLDLQEKLRKEILSTLEKHNGQITYDAIMEMDYLDRVLKETSRKYPILLFLKRKCTENYTIPNTDVQIEKGTIIFVPIIGLHRDAEYYENPEEFNPDNFLPEKVAKRRDFTYLAFGEGQRLCIGMRFGKLQSKMGLVYLLKNFKFTLPETMKPPFEPPQSARLYLFDKDALLVASKIAN